MNRSPITQLVELLARGVLLCTVVAFVGCDAASESTVDTLPNLDSLLAQSGQTSIMIPGEHADSLLYAGSEVGQVWLRHLAPGWTTVFPAKDERVGAIYVFSAKDNRYLAAFPVDVDTTVFFPTVHRVGTDSLMILSYVFDLEGERTRRGIHPYVLQVHKVTPETCELVFSKSFMFLEYRDDQDLPTQVFFLALNDVVFRTLLVESEATVVETGELILGSRATLVWDEEKNTFVPPVVDTGDEDAP